MGVFAVIAIHFLIAYHQSLLGLKFVSVIRFRIRLS